MVVGRFGSKINPDSSTDTDIVNPGPFPWRFYYGHFHMAGDPTTHVGTDWIAGKASAVDHFKVAAVFPLDHFLEFAWGQYPEFYWDPFAGSGFVPTENDVPQLEDGPVISPEPLRLNREQLRLNRKQSLGTSCWRSERVLRCLAAWACSQVK